MNIAEFQRWMIARGAQITADGIAGPRTRAAIPLLFSNRTAPAVSDMEMAGFARRIGITTKQMRAISIVESGGAAFDNRGRPKILFERHVFHRRTSGRYGVQPWSNPKAGGYGESSWTKLTAAASVSPIDAFAACSWGKFQVMGFHAAALGFSTALDLAWATVLSEAGSYDLLLRYIQVNGLSDEARLLSTNPNDCRPFARSYNGTGYERNEYHIKLARAMR